MTSKDDFDKASLRKQIDHDDLQREIAGLDTGRMRRFLPQAMSEQDKREKRRKAEETYLTALQVLLLNPAYASLYTETKELIDQATAAVGKAREDLLEELGEVEAQLMELRTNASKLPDGTLVFIDENREYVDEYGHALDEEQQASVIRLDTTPSWSDYAETMDRQRELNGQLQSVDIYERDVIIPGQVRMEDKDNPLSLDEVEGLKREIHSEMPKSVRVELNKSLSLEQRLNATGSAITTAAEYGLEESDVEKRGVTKSFDRARLDIPDIGETVDAEIKPKFE